MVKVDDYAPIVGEGEVEGIKQLAELIKGEKVVHINATPYGGGVAEILSRIIPLAKSLDIDANWQTLKGDTEFFTVTKKMHNALQGNQEVALSEAEWRHYFDTVRFNSSILNLEGDVLVIHDPQPLPLIEYRRGGKWAWRCHIDTSSPNLRIWGPLMELVQRYNIAIFSLEKYIPRNLETQVLIDHPTIDPLATKNAGISVSEIEKTLNRYGVDPERPIIGQVGRFDPWKDPLGAIAVHRMVKARVRAAQLVLIGSFAKDDPEAAEWYEKAMAFAAKEKDVFVLTNLDGVGDLEVNAFQRAFSVALQMSKREGFGLTVTEALWKGVPVVGTRAGGISLQVIDGATGYLIDNYEEAAEKTALLLKKPWLARELGQSGRRHVKLNFLITKGIMNYLRMHIELVGKRN
jgi:trehalose synthase